MPRNTEETPLDVDVEVDGHGSIAVLYPMSGEAIDWCLDHLPEDCPRWGGLGYAVEMNYARDIVEGMQADGLTVI